MPVNILYASHTASPKGSAVSMHQLIRGLDRSRYNPVVAFSKPGPMTGMLASEGVESVVLDRRGPLGLGLVRQSLRLIEDEAIGLVHLNSAVPFVKYVGMAARLAGVPVVWHIREDARGKRVRAAKKWARLLADRIIVISTDLENLFASTGKAVKVYNGVDTEMFNPEVDGSEFRARAGLPAGGFVFGFVGTIEPRKGTMLFMQAADVLVKAGRDVRFVLVGSGMPEYEEELRGFLAARPELARRTYLSGRITGVHEAMAAMDTVVMPSLVEPFGRVVIEAMAAGRPVVASAVGEVPYILDGGRLGFMFPPGDASALADAMAICMEAESGRGEMLSEARTRAVETFNIKEHTARICAIYDELIDPVGNI